MAAAESADGAAAGEQVVALALEHIGDDWERGSVSLAQVYMAGRIAEQIVREVFPQSGRGEGEAPQIAIAVLEDQHALGKRLVLSALRSSGHAVADYGLGVSVQRLVRRCQEDKPRILLISTLMLPAALHVRDVVDQLVLSAPRPVVLGGAPPFRLDPELWREMGADAVGRNSAEAIELVDRFTGGVR